MNFVRQAIQACRIAIRVTFDNNIVPYKIIIYLFVLY